MIGPCTPHAERIIGSIRLFRKRMNLLTYAFSKRWDNHGAALRGSSAITITAVSTKV
jgi:hypothetical protein